MYMDFRIHSFNLDTANPLVGIIGPRIGSDRSGRFSFADELLRLMVCNVRFLRVSRSKAKLGYVTLYFFTSLDSRLIGPSGSFLSVTNDVVTLELFLFFLFFLIWINTRLKFLESKMNHDRFD